MSGQNPLTVYSGEPQPNWTKQDNCCQVSGMGFPTMLFWKLFGFVAVPRSEIPLCLRHEVKLSGRVHRNPCIPILSVNGPVWTNTRSAPAKDSSRPSVWPSTHTAPFTAYCSQSILEGVSFQRQTFLLKKPFLPPSPHHHQPSPPKKICRQKERPALAVFT